jgi:hypothetical protein
MSKEVEEYWKEFVALDSRNEPAHIHDIDMIDIETACRFSRFCIEKERGDREEKLKVLLHELHGNNQLFIPRNKTIQEWVDVAVAKTTREMIGKINSEIGVVYLSEIAPYNETDSASGGGYYHCPHCHEQQYISAAEVGDTVKCDCGDKYVFEKPPEK